MHHNFSLYQDFYHPGGWCAGLSCSGDFGNNGQWSVVPLPGALPLFITGLAMLGLLGWRRKRKPSISLSAQ